MPIAAIGVSAQQISELLLQISLFGLFVKMALLPIHPRGAAPHARWGFPLALYAVVLVCSLLLHVVAAAIHSAHGAATGGVPSLQRHLTGRITMLLLTAVLLCESYFALVINNIERRKELDKDA